MSEPSQFLGSVNIRLTNKWPCRGTHLSVKELAASITYWVSTWNDDPRPYV